MNSALKPALPTASVGATAAAGGQASPAKAGAGGQASPAKAAAAGPNHAAAHPHSGLNSHNNLVGQNLVQHPPAVPPHLPHAVPSMAPISANMAQMAQNMSHHGNLSHITGNSNSVAPPVPSTAPSKPTGAPLSLVQDKPATPASTQPLALTRTPEKKEGDANSQTNGTDVSPKPAANAPAEVKPQNAESSKDKADIAKTPATAPSLPEKASPSTPQKADVPSSVNQPDGPEQPKVATASEPPEKSPAKPAEPKSIPAADVAPSQSDSKPESAKDSQEKPVPTPSPAKEAPKVAAAKPEVSKPEPAKPEEKKPDPAVAKPAAAKPAVPKPVEEKKEPVTDAVDGPKKVEKVVEKVEKPEVKKTEAVEKKPVESLKPAPKVETKAAVKSTIKLATVTTPVRKRRQTSPNKAEGATPAKKVAEGNSTPDSRIKRNRTKVQPYQSPTPELTMATKLSASAAGRATPPKQTDDKLIVFYKNEYLAVRNAEGSFYVCQALQNVYRTSRKIKIRWLSQDKATDPSGETYKPDFYDVTDMETVLTTLSLSRAPSGGGSQILKAAEENRVKSILERALKAEKGDKPASSDLTEEHPDGLDLSLYKDESQLEKKSRKRKVAKQSPRKSDADSSSSASPAKKATPTKRSPRGAKPLATPPAKPTTTPPTGSKRKLNSAGSTPVVGAPSKTAVQDATPKSSPKVTPKKTPAKPVKALTPKVDTTPKTGRRSGKVEAKLTPIVPTPSTSTGKATRTPRKPPAKK